MNAVDHKTGLSSNILMLWQPIIGCPSQLSIKGLIKRCCVEVLRDASAAGLNDFRFLLSRLYLMPACRRLIDGNCDHVKNVIGATSA
jgi:hypothetical protein